MGTSLCIDVGYPHKAVAYEPFPNGGIVNIGAYGGTTEASKSSSGLHAKYGGGSGEPNNPYLIFTANQMNEIGASPDDWDKHFRLTTDIDLKEYNGTIFNIIGTWNSQHTSSNIPFTGVFDGNHHTISNFNYTSTSLSGIGLFGYIDDSSAEIRNLGMINSGIQSEIKNGNYIGVLVGYLSSGSVSGCYVQGGSSIGHANVGGLVGKNEGQITNCYASGWVFGQEYIGGLVGLNTGTITSSYANGSVFGERHCIGGLVGRGGGVITNCYSRSSVSGDEDIGGLVGHNNFGTITNCYSMGNVSGTFSTGGLVGSSSSGTLTNCFWNSETSGLSNSDGGTGKTTSEMQMESTFANAKWDFVDETENGTEDIWWILEGQDYPRLFWELTEDNQ